MIAHLRVLGGVALITAVSMGCVKKPAVSTEQLFEREPSKKETTDTVTPPWCSELPAAIYPDGLPAGERPERVDVRVDFVLDVYGKAKNADATVLGDVANPGPFLDAAREATGNLRCVPAMRPPNPDAGREKTQTIAYRTALMFRFFKDGRNAEATLEQP